MKPPHATPNVLSLLKYDKWADNHGRFLHCDLEKDVIDEVSTSLMQLITGDIYSSY